MNARRWRRPTARAVALAVFGVALFGALGAWQWRRAAEKERLLAAFRTAAAEAPVDLAAVRDGADPARYPHVRVAGRYLADRGYLLDEQVHAGRVGVHAIGVFAPLGESRLLLVDRGWVAWDHAPGTRPALPPPAPGEVTLRGLYAPFPGGGLRLGGDPLPGQRDWPKLTLRLDPGEIAADLGRPLLPRLLLLDAEADAGFVREWTPSVLPPERHRAYAVQWWLFAAIAAGVFVAQHWRKVENAKK